MVGWRFKMFKMLKMFKIGVIFNHWNHDSQLSVFSFQAENHSSKIHEKSIRRCWFGLQLRVFASNKYLPHPFRYPSCFREFAKFQGVQRVQHGPTAKGERKISHGIFGTNTRGKHGFFQRGRPRNVRS